MAVKKKRLYLIDLPGTLKKNNELKFNFAPLAVWILLLCESLYFFFLWLINR